MHQRYHPCPHPAVWRDSDFPSLPKEGIERWSSKMEDNVKLLRFVMHPRQLADTDEQGKP